MALILGGIAAAAIAAQALWRRITHESPMASLMASRNVKLSTNLIIVTAQAVGYIAELLGGTRTNTPATLSTTTAVEDKPRFGERAGRVTDAEAVPA
jgi:hypothetical protein